MEIKELASVYVNDSNQTLGVTFRLITDSEDMIRTDQIDLDVVESFGLNLERDFDNSFDDEDDDDYLESMIRSYEADFDLDEDDIISFLNEYYMVNPKKLPKPELY